ncbi:hypothetical protein GCM10010222_49180 [Streptomyces tanashiensis]|nr:hypothetical protein GCM10010222_49180 [Streptomyces tanashiensis]
MTCVLQSHDSRLRLLPVAETVGRQKQPGSVRPGDRDGHRGRPGGLPQFFGTTGASRIPSSVQPVSVLMRWTLPGSSITRSPTR